MNTLKFKRLHADATLPQRATDGSAGYDLCALESDGMAPGASVTLRTGVAVEIPAGYVGLVFSRSGDGFKRDTRLANCVGVIDSDYRGEVLVKLRSDGQQSFMVEPGQRVAQLVVVPCLMLEPIWSDELESTERGEGGFGSTGK